MMIDVDAIKKEILKIALSGKLTKQLKEDGDASSLLESIRKKKESLKLLGNIRNKKTSTYEIDDISFDIPSNWTWCFIEDVSFPVGNKSNQIQSSQILSNGPIPVVSQGKTFIDGYTDCETKKIIDVPVVLFGDHTKIVKYIDFPFVVGADGTKLFKPILVNPKFFYYQVLLASKEIYALGYARHYSLLKKKPMPLPPLSEQTRIVEKLDSAFNELDLIKEKQELLAFFKDKFINKILELSIRGKLVEQNENDNALLLLDSILAFKKKLLKEGVIKKDKKIKEIDNEEIPFDIPSNWCWVRLGTITLNWGQITPNERISYLDIGSIDNVNHKLSSEENIIEAGKAPSRAKKIVRFGDVIYSTVRPYLHNICIIDKEFTCRPIASTGFAVVGCPPGLLNKYLFYYFLSATFDDYANDTQNAKGTLYPAIGEEKFANALVPLPPFEEQKRIVERIESIFHLCEKMIQHEKD